MKKITKGVLSVLVIILFLCRPAGGNAQSPGTTDRKGLQDREDTLKKYAAQIIYAEDPSRDFLPSIGKLIHLHTPANSAHVRIDTGVEQGDTITPFYDPMIAKLIVWDETRELALDRMTRALAEYQIVGVANNASFLLRLITSPSFTAANLDTSLIEREHKWLSAPDTEPSDTAIVLAALSVILREHPTDSTSPWAMRDGWRLNATYQRSLVFTHHEREITAVVEYLTHNYHVTTGKSTHSVSGETHSDGSIHAIIDSQSLQATVIASHNRLHIFHDHQTHVLTLNDPLEISSHHHAKESSLIAPMPGRIISLLVQPGELVEKGAPLMILEAMKMECTIHAPSAGRVEAFLFSAGDQVTEGAELLRFDTEAKPSEN